MYDIDSSEKHSTVQYDTKAGRGIVYYNMIQKQWEAQYGAVRYKSGKKHSAAQYDTKLVTVVIVESADAVVHLSRVQI